MAAAALLEELLEEVLFRIPPDDPASLVRAALVSKRWCRLICGRGFRRRFREFHGNPPLLGIVRQRHTAALERFFVPSSSFRPRCQADSRTMRAVHSCHGRVLLHSTPSRGSVDMLADLFLWDPITDKLRKLPRWQLQLEASHVDGNGDAAVLCADLGDGCDHLDCHRHGPFLVVLAGIDRRAETFVCVYSSEADRWGAPIYAGRRFVYIDRGNSVLIGSAVYFKGRASTQEPAILKYDLLTQEISLIHGPRGGIMEHIKHEYIVLMAMDDGRLGVAGVRKRSTTLFLWSRWEHGTDEDARWEQSRVIELDTVLHKHLKRAHVVAFANAGTGVVIFIWSCDRLFSLDLKSGSSKVVGDSFGLGRVVPYVTFCTPVLAAVSLEE